MPMAGVYTDLRRSVARATHLAITWTAADIAEATGHDEAHVRTYLKTLVKSSVLVEVGGGFRAGTQAKMWRATKPKTKP